MNKRLDEREQEIERLTKKIEQYENPEDMTLMFMWCDEKAKDEIKRLNNIINEIYTFLSQYTITHTWQKVVIEDTIKYIDELTKRK